MKMSQTLCAVVAVLVIVGCGRVGAQEADPQPMGTAADEQPATPDASLAELMAPDARVPSSTPNETWGAFDPGKGFLLGKTPRGELSISAYALLRYMNQMPGSQTYHGPPRQRTSRRGPRRLLLAPDPGVAERLDVQPETDLHPHFWTVNTTDQDAIFGNLGYQFCKQFNLYGGVDRERRVAVPARFASLLARAPTGSWPTSFSAPSSPRASMPTANCCPDSSIRRWSATTTASSGPRPPTWTATKPWRLPVVDADHPGIRPARRLWRLRDARRTGHAVRRLRHLQPGTALQRRAAIPRTPPSNWPTA